MTAMKTIDIDDEPPLLRSVTMILDGHEPVRLRRAGEDLAIVTPVLSHSTATSTRRVQTPEDLAEFLNIAGG